MYTVHFTICKSGIPFAKVAHLLHFIQLDIYPARPDLTHNSNHLSERLLWQPIWPLICFYNDSHFALYQNWFKVAFLCALLWIFWKPILFRKLLCVFVKFVFGLSRFVRFLFACQVSFLLSFFFVKLIIVKFLFLSSFFLQVVFADCLLLSFSNTQ